MRTYYTYIFLLSALLGFSSCEKMLMEKESDGNALDNFETISNVISEKYSYLELKKINWDSIVDANRVKVRDGMNLIEEFDIYDKMLYALKDGHVNLNSGFDLSRNWQWYLGYPSNFSYDLVERNYLGNNYFISGGLKHKILTEDYENEEIPRYGYIYYKSFSRGLSYIDFVKSYMNAHNVKGLIIDVRDNGGGYLKNAKKFADNFTDENKVGYQVYYKSGPGHNEFDKPITTNIEPKGEKFSKPVIVLTNRQCYSSTSFFVTMMKEIPNVTILGDVTGGGAGLPVDYILPNGWILRYSTTRATDKDGVDFELGVEPDEYLDMKEADISRGIDTLIERAKEIIDGK